MKSKAAFPGIVLVLIAVVGIAMAADPRQELLDSVAIKPGNGLRGLVDTVGYATTAVQMDSVVARCRRAAAPRSAALVAEQGWGAGTPFAAAVCPHDDYRYAGRLYALLLPHIRARTVVVFGVFHRASAFDCRDKLVFGSFRAWRGPYGPVTVSPLRDVLISRLPPGDIVVDDDMETVEHSVEGIVPWLQAYDRDVEIVPILVPYMGWDTLDRLAAESADALAGVMKERGWSLGRDVAIIVSSDAVHYGDAGWGGSDFAPFGTGIDGYAKAVERDRDLAGTLLAGPIEREHLRRFLYTCVDSTDVTCYRITWCGRFSIPFGLDVASRVTEALGRSALAGTLLDYGTSVSESSLDSVPGLGTTAPNNFHHWVGYASIGYR